MTKEVARLIHLTFLVPKFMIVHKIQGVGIILCQPSCLEPIAGEA